MEKKLIIIAEIVFVVIAVGYYTVKELIPDFKKQFGSSDRIVNPEKCTNIIEIKINDDVDYIYLLDNEEKMIVEGYAVVFDSVTDLGWSKEVIDRNAFNGCDMSDVCMKYNHEDNVLIMARTRNKSLELIVDDIGLKIRAKLIDTASNRDIYKSVKEGLLDKMSFGFTYDREDYDYETDTRRILSIDKLYDVSVVDVPFYDETYVIARSKDSFIEEKQVQELNLKKLKARLLLDL